jgi:hypothetical protein
MNEKLNASVGANHRFKTARLPSWTSAEMPPTATNRQNLTCVSRAGSIRLNIA